MHPFIAKSIRQTLIGLCVTVALACLLRGSASAQAPLTETQQNAAIANLQNVVAALQNTVNNLSAKEVAQQTTITALQNSMAKETARAQQAEAALANRATALETKTQFMSADAASRATVFSGCNLFLNNGLGATNGLPHDPLNINPAQTRTNGLGNLILGYNESRALWGDPDNRTGSHNLIVGQFQDYSSFGGLVAGACNTISGAYASVLGGDTNIAGGAFASISGGESNMANGSNASVLGGNFNLAIGNFATVSGGAANLASGLNASVSGGALNDAHGISSSVSGGQSNTASVSTSAISGGIGITQLTMFGWSGGKLHSP
ncbi:MAG TPA: hypothetical protein VKU00_11320 [Chthonomonadaceae bacterium]|nr:hypothetical protein [Chthonomonadaceae bacterium]